MPGYSRMEKKQTSSRLYLSAFFILSVLVIIFARLHTYDEPLESDITTYAVIAHEMLEGRELYSDLVDIKPPGIFLTYAAMEMITGYGIKSIFLLNVLAAIITLFGTYSAGRSITGGKVAGGLWAMVIWTVISGDLFYQANQPNVEVVLNACIIWAFAVFVGGYSSLGKYKHLVIGALIAFATIHKQISIIIYPLFYCFHLVFPPGAKGRRDVIFDIIMSGSVILITWILISFYFYFTGRFEDFYDVIFVYSSSYSGNLGQNIVEGFSLYRLIPLANPAVLPLLLFTILGLITGIARNKREWYMVTAYLLGTQIMVSLPGKFFPHYYQLWLPLVAVGSGGAFLEIKDLIRNNFKWIANVLPVAIVLIILISQAPLYSLSPTQWSREKYGELFIVTREAAREIDRVLEPGETFYEYGPDTGLYFYSKRTPPTGIFLFYPLVEGPLVHKYSKRVIEDLKNKKPELLILPQKLPVGHPLIEWISSGCWKLIRDNYCGYLVLFARCGGELDKRLTSSSIGN